MTGAGYLILLFSLGTAACAYGIFRLFGILCGAIIPGIAISVATRTYFDASVQVSIGSGAVAYVVAVTGLSVMKISEINAVPRVGDMVRRIDWIPIRAVAGAIGLLKPAMAKIAKNGNSIAAGLAAAFAIGLSGLVSPTFGLIVTAVVGYFALASWACNRFGILLCAAVPGMALGAVPWVYFDASVRVSAWTGAIAYLLAVLFLSVVVFSSARHFGNRVRRVDSYLLRAVGSVNDIVYAVAARLSGRGSVIAAGFVGIVAGGGGCFLGIISEGVGLAASLIVGLILGSVAFFLAYAASRIAARRRPFSDDSWSSGGADHRNVWSSGGADSGRSLGGGGESGGGGSSGSWGDGGGGGGDRD